MCWFILYHKLVFRVDAVVVTQELSEDEEYSEEDEEEQEILNIRPKPSHKGSKGRTISTEGPGRASGQVGTSKMQNTPSASRHHQTRKRVEERPSSTRRDAIRRAEDSYSEGECGIVSIIDVKLIQLYE